jgi:NAD(P)-dependent dehydrogenase (short-subunit alcohol dehydrogenase family)
MSILEQRTGFVTGGGRGLGRGIALELAKEGADLCIADLILENARDTAAEIEKLGRRASAVEIDVTDESSVGMAVETALAAHQRIDILINNAGVTGEHRGSEVVLRDWEMCLNVNLKGIWIVSRAFIDHFKANQYGKIINISSIAGRQGSERMPAYCASKAGVISLTQSLASELAPANINVNTICPGLIWTDMWRNLEEIYTGAKTTEEVERRQRFEQMINESCPFGREQTPEDIGMATAFLASDRARNITGQALNIDGGHVMS